MLKEIAPRVRRVAIMFNPDTAPGGGTYFLDPFKAAARSLAMEPITSPVRSDAEIEAVIASLGREQAGLVIMADSFRYVSCTAAPDSIIYVLHGLHAGAPHGFAELHAQPVINSAIELAEWDAFVSSNGWSGGCALNVDTGENRLGLSMTEAVQLSGRTSFLNHGITLLMSTMANTETADGPHERQIS